MRNSILVIFSLFLSACGMGFEHKAYVNSGEINNLLKSEYGTVEISEDDTIKVLAPKDYTINVLRNLARKNNYDLSVEWDRQYITFTYKADQIYTISVHAGNSVQALNCGQLSKVDLFSAITFDDIKPSELFKKQLMDAFKEEQIKHDPMKHIDATYITNLKLVDTKLKFEQFLRKLYPKGKFMSVTINGKLYQVAIVMRSSSKVVSAADCVYYAFKPVTVNQTEIHLHTAAATFTHEGELITNATKEKSQQVLDKIVKKLGL